MIGCYEKKYQVDTDLTSSILTSCDYVNLFLNKNLGCSKLSKILKMILFCFQIKCWLCGLEFKFCQNSKREDPDQTASSEVVRFGFALFVLAIYAGN